MKESTSDLDCTSFKTLLQITLDHKYGRSSLEIDVKDDAVDDIGLEEDV